jgi:hypothetical protein
MLPNCPVTWADIAAAEDIFGFDVGSLKGKTTRIPPHVVKPTERQLDAVILQRYKNVELSVDIMYINQIPFLVIFILERWKYSQIDRQRRW